MAGVDEYSTTAASNTTINSIDIAENCDASGINDALRQIMADIRAALNDIGAKAVSSGTNTVTLATQTGYSGAYADGTVLGFIAGGTNTGAATLNVDSVGAKAIRKGADVALDAGDITAGMLCIVAYDASANSGSGAWMLAGINTANLLTAAAAAAAYQPLAAALTALATAFAAASSSGPASLTLAEDTDNGSNKITITAPASVASDRTFTLPDASGTPALLDVEDQTISGGARITEKDLGTVSSGTLTPDPGDRQMQKAVNGGAFTLAPGSNVGTYILTITNNGSAGAITTSGWTKVVGSFDTTDTHVFRCSCSIGAAGSLLMIQRIV